MKKLPNGIKGSVDNVEYSILGSRAVHIKENSTLYVALRLNDKDWTVKKGEATCKLDRIVIEMMRVASRGKVVPVKEAAKVFNLPLEQYIAVPV